MTNSEFERMEIIHTDLAIDAETFANAIGPTLPEHLKEMVAKQVPDGSFIEVRVSFLPNGRRVSLCLVKPEIAVVELYSCGP
jgi:hypothetical protein